MATRVIPPAPNAASARQRKTNYRRELISVLHGAVKSYGPCPLATPVANVSTGGSRMQALLGPDLGDGQQRGTKTSAASLQPLMGLLNSHSAKRWKAGHLLNADLGGDGNSSANLTPLTAAANNAHRIFEGHIKRMLLLCNQLDRADSHAASWYGVFYDVRVSGTPYAAAPAVGDMHSYAPSYIRLSYRFVTLPKFPPGSNPYQGLPPPASHQNVAIGDANLAALQAVVLPTFAPSVNITNWLPHASGIEFRVRIHNEP